MPNNIKNLTAEIAILRLIISQFGFLVPMVLWALGGIIVFHYISSPDLFLLLNAIRAPWADYLFTVTDLLGEGWGQLLFVIIYFFRKKRSLALLMAITFSFSGLVSQFLKKVVFPDALRPLAFFKELGITPQSMPWITMRSYNSFPSGHTITCFSFFCCLAIIYKKPLWGLGFFLLAVLGCYSRIYEGQHFPIDVYAGALIGVVCNLIVMLVVYRFFPKYKSQLSLD